MAEKRKGLQDIKTMAGRCSSPGATHKAYIRLSVLEMERVRRQHEYETFKAKADAAKSRVDMLRAEINSTIASIAEGGVPTSGAQRAAAPADPELVAIKHAYGASKTKRRIKKGEPA